MMTTALAILILVVVVVIILVVKHFLGKAGDALGKAANQKLLNRTGHERGQAAIRAKTEFRVPGVAAATVIETVLRELDFPTQAPLALIRRLVVVERKSNFVLFASATRGFRAFQSSFVVVDAGGGAFGTYEVIRWSLADGIVVDWKEMETLAHRIARIVGDMGGSAWAANEGQAAAPQPNVASTMAAAPQPDVARTMAFCRDCGNPLDEGARFCGTCGRRL